MQPLPYQQSPEPRTTAVLLVLCTLPIVAFYVGMLTGVFAFGEPFFVLKAADAAMFFGAPVAVVALGVIWCRLALANRVHRILILLVLVCFALVTAATVQETLMYLREPWNV